MIVVTHPPKLDEDDLALGGAMRRPPPRERPRGGHEGRAIIRGIAAVLAAFPWRHYRVHRNTHEEAIDVAADESQIRHHRSAYDGSGGGSGHGLSPSARAADAATRHRRPIHPRGVTAAAAVSHPADGVQVSRGQGGWAPQHLGVRGAQVLEEEPPADGRVGQEGGGHAAMAAAASARYTSSRAAR